LIREGRRGWTACLFRVGCSIDVKLIVDRESDADDVFFVKMIGTLVKNRKWKKVGNRKKFESG